MTIQHRVTNQHCISFRLLSSHEIGKLVYVSEIFYEMWTFPSQKDKKTQKIGNWKKLSEKISRLLLNQKFCFYVMLQTTRLRNSFLLQCQLCRNRPPCRQSRHRASRRLTSLLQCRNSFKETTWSTRPPLKGAISQQTTSHLKSYRREESPP